MNDIEPPLPEDIRKALKESPTFTPPESFYQGVLREIERKRAPAQQPSPWYWGYPAKGLTAACLLMVMVLVVREKKPVLTQPSSPGAAPSPSSEVQNRLSRSISGLIDNPSPFEEEDLKLRAQLQARQDMSRAVEKDAEKNDLANTKTPEHYLEQARDTSGGIASQGSFLQERQVLDLAKKQKAVAREAPMHAETSAPVMVAAKAAGYSLAYGRKEETEGKNPSWRGTFSGISTFRTVVIRTPDEWIALWREHASNKIPPPAAPGVDFGQWTIVGLFSGNKPTAGYTIEIVDIQMLPDRIVVKYRESNPPAGMAAAAILTQPYDLRAVPKTSLPVTFEKLSS